MKGTDAALTLLVLSLMVACAGFAYRNITSSISRLYLKALREQLGPLADELVNSPTNSWLRIRGPFQFTNILLPRIQLPLSRDEFIDAFESVAPGVYGEALAILARLPEAREGDRGSDRAFNNNASDRPSPEWDKFVLRLREDQKNQYAAREILDISDNFGVGNWSRIRAAIWQLFPDCNDLISHYDKFLKKVDQENHRRNFRQLAVIAGLLAASGNITLTNALTGSLAFGNPFYCLLHASCLRTLPGLILSGQHWVHWFESALRLTVGCLLPTLTIAGLADFLDRHLFRVVWADFADVSRGNKEISRRGN